MLNRREFLRFGAGAGTLLASGAFPFEAFAKGEYQKVTLLHTNDVHSRIEPFPMDGSEFQGLGGVAQRATIINRIRAEEKHVVLLDAGDIFQGTPYFNFYDGEIEFKLMNSLGYDAATIGNHDFDGGMEALRKQVDAAKFPLVNANYDFSDTNLTGKLPDFTIIERGEIRLGVFGLGVELDGLVPSKLYGSTQYNDPVEAANRVSRMLKNDYNCSAVICLSHLGYQYPSTKVSDSVLAGLTSDIDVIIGGHTHTFMESPQEYRSKEGEKVIINQVGWAGIFLGRIDLLFDRGKLKGYVPGLPEMVGKKAS